MLVERSNFTVSRMGRLLGVSRSGFYAWLGRAPSQRAIRAERIEAKVAWFHGDSDEVSGSPRILADLREDGEVISRKTVAKTMRKLHLVGVCPKRWKTTTLIDHADAYPVDAVKRNWDQGELNRVWVGNGLTRSMGYTGICWDNSMAESFFATLKTEFYYRRVWSTKKAARIAVGAWIEDRYNRRRRHASIGQITPVAFELQYSRQIANSQEAA